MTSHSTRLSEALRDLAALGNSLQDTVDQHFPSRWDSLTPAPGWSVATQVAHLHWTDQQTLFALQSPKDFTRQAREMLEKQASLVDSEAHRLAQVPGEQLLRDWRATREELNRALTDHDPSEKMPWFGPPMRPASVVRARIMETWAHGQDIADAVGANWEGTVALPHVAKLGYATFGFSFANRGLPVPEDSVFISLWTPPSPANSSPGDSKDVIKFGPSDAPNKVTGSLRDFCLLVTQRINVADTDLIAEGEDARKWLQIAQAFAGPAGEGRSPGAR